MFQNRRTSSSGKIKKDVNVNDRGTSMFDTPSIDGQNFLL